MSIATWKKEFYPIPAGEIEEQNAIAHSLQKWTGLLPENLKKHGIEIDLNNDLYDGTFLFYINSGTCALCAYYIYSTVCSDCPIYIKTGNECGESLSQWVIWADSSDPQPMIELLKGLKK